MPEYKEGRNPGVVAVYGARMSFGGRRPWPLTEAVVGAGVHEKWFEELAIISKVFENGREAVLPLSKPTLYWATNPHTVCLSICLSKYLYVCLLLSLSFHLSLPAR